MTTGTALILFFLVTLLITLRWLRGSWKKALVSMVFAPAFLGVVAPISYFMFGLLLLGINTLLTKTGTSVAIENPGIIAGVLTGMLLLALTAIYGVGELRTRKPRSRIAIAGSPML